MGSHLYLNKILYLFLLIRVKGLFFFFKIFFKIYKYIYIQFDKIFKITNIRYFFWSKKYEIDVSNSYNFSNLNFEKNFKRNSEFKDKLIKFADNYLNQIFLINGKSYKYSDINFNYCHRQKKNINNFHFYELIPSNIFFRQPWEIGRFHSLLLLGIAYKINNEQKYKSHIFYFLEKYYSEGKFGFGIHWVDGLQLSIKLFNLIFLYSHLYKSLAYDEKIFLISLIRKNLFFLTIQQTKNFELKNNHYIGELAAQILSLCFFKKNKLLQQQLYKLYNILDLIYNEDNLSNEGSLPYNCFKLQILVYLYIFLSKNCDLNINKLKIYISNYSISLYNFSNQLNIIPHIGDFDEGSVFKIFDENYLDINNLLMMSSEIICKDFIYKDSNNYLYNLFFNKKNKHSIIKKNYINIFHKSNLIHIYKDNFSFYFNYGYQGMGKLNIGAHSHNDMGSFLIDYNGNKLFVDKGTYKYELSNLKRYLFLTSHSHNCINIKSYKDLIFLNNFFYLPRQKLIKFKIIKTKYVFIGIKYSLDKDLIITRLIKIQILDKNIDIYFSDKVKSKKQINPYINLNLSILPDNLSSNKNNFLLLMNELSNLKIKKTFISERNSQLKKCYNIQSNLIQNISKYEYTFYQKKWLVSLNASLF